MTTALRSHDGLAKYSTPVATQGWWHIKAMTPTGLVSRWASPRLDDDDRTTVDGDTIVQRAGARAICDGTAADPMSRCVAVAPHPSGDRVAYALDPSGSEHLELWIRSIETDAADRLVATSVTHSFAWGVAGNADTIYFVTVDDTLRPCTVQSADWDGTRRTVFTEPDPVGAVRISRAGTDDYLIVHSVVRRSTRVAVIDESGQPTMLRTPGIEPALWHVDTIREAGGAVRWIALTDLPDGGGARRHFRILSSPVQQEDWTMIFDDSHREVRSMYALGSHALLDTRVGATEQYLSLSADGTVGHVLDADRWHGRPALCVPDLQLVTDRAVFRFMVSTPVDPPFTVDVDSAGRCRSTREEPEANHYDIDETSASSHDGLDIPITVIRSRVSSMPAPCVVEVYGAYGVAIGRRFDPHIVRLLDAGIAVAFVHVRGGSERGPGWHALGIGTGKVDSVRDLLGGLEALRDHAWIDSDRLAAWGTSAGGTFVAAAINAAPGALFAAAMDVPFVDPLTSLSDPDAPLSLRDRAEWGDPAADDSVRRAMQGYSPVQNVRDTPPGDRPMIRVTAGRTDPRAPLADIERWVAAMHATGSTATDLSVVVDVGGHNGASTRGETVDWLIHTLEASTTTGRNQ